MVLVRPLPSWVCWKSAPEMTLVLNRLLVGLANHNKPPLHPLPPPHAPPALLTTGLPVFSKDDTVCMTGLCGFFQEIKTGLPFGASVWKPFRYCVKVTHYKSPAPSYIRHQLPLHLPPPTPPTSHLHLTPLALPARYDNNQRAGFATLQALSVIDDKQPE